MVLLGMLGTAGIVSQATCIISCIALGRHKIYGQMLWAKYVLMALFKLNPECFAKTIRIWPYLPLVLISSSTY